MKLNILNLQKLLHNKKVVILSLAIPLIVISLLVGSTYIVKAAWGTWGDNSLVHACKDSRGRIAIVSSTDSCNQNETQITWVKDVEAGTGLTATRNSSGVTLSLASDNADGWNSAGETWTYASADDPTYTFTISGDKTNKYSAGMRLKLTQTSVKYFLVTKVAYSSPNTTITVYGGTDYDLADAAISNPYYSTDKAPLSFPLDPSKWTEKVSVTNPFGQANPTNNTWYNPGSTSLTIPIGIWNVKYFATPGTLSSGTDIATAITLSTANNAESEAELTSYYESKATANASGGSTLSEEKVVSLTSKTTYYLNTRTLINAAYLYFRGDYSPTIIKAVSAYL